MNKLTVGLRVMGLCVVLVSPPAGPCWTLDSLQSRTGQKYLIQSDRIGHVTSDRCDVTLVAKRFLDYIRELMTSFFPHYLMTLTHHTYSIMLRSVHCISHFTTTRFSMTSLSLLLFKPVILFLSTSECTVKCVSCIGPKPSTHSESNPYFNYLITINLRSVHSQC